MIRQDIKIGDSIAVNGACLTVSSLGTDWFSADATPETVRRTGLLSLNPGDRVNLERALRCGDRLGGHLVSGHSDGVGIVTGSTTEGNATWLTIEAPAAIMKYIVLKGSVALDGASLTVASVDDRCFKVTLIPLTTGMTNLAEKKTGDRINIECDMIGKYVEKLLNGVIPAPERHGGISWEFLKKNGFA